MKAKREAVSSPSSQPAKPSAFPSNPDGKENVSRKARVVKSCRKDKESMGRYLNPDDDSFASCKRFSLYVDKSMLIKETNACFGIDEAKFMCVTRPRRFGKTMALKMLNAYYSKKNDSRELFKDLKISKGPSFEEHLNKHNVLWVDMTGIYADAADKSDFVSELRQELIDALKESYPSVITEKEDSARKAFAKVREETGERFVFLIDEWDVIYREQSHSRKVCDDYTEFLRSLFKSSDASKCFDLVYMTGILPIRRYNTQSALNMFREYDVLKPRGLASLFGFTEDEVKGLCKKHNAGFPEIKDWYDGYRLGGIEIYNPKSVVEAIRDGECGGHWVATSSVEAVTDYMDYDHGILKGEIVRMLAGERVALDPDKFGSDLTRVDSKDAALTVLVHLGYLAFIPGPNDDRGVCYIPNKEIAKEFELAVEALDWKDIYDPISNSPKLLKATLDGDVGAMCS